MRESPESEQARILLARLINEGGIPPSYNGPVWDTAGMQEDFEAIGFAAPFVVVRRRSDGVKGTLTFTHSPRHYFDFVPTS